MASSLRYLVAMMVCSLWGKQVVFFWVLCCLMLAAVAPVRAAERIAAAADEQRLWIVVQRIDDKRFTLYERRHQDPPGIARPFGPVSGQFSGMVAQHGVAAAHERLWVVFNDNTVQSFRLVEDPVVRPMPDMRRNPRLPEGAELRSFQVGRTPWALLRIDNPRTLGIIDATAPPAPEPTEADEAAVPPSSPPVRYPVDRLVYLKGDTWVRRDLPDDWVSTGRNFIVMRRPNDETPWLVSAVRQSGRDELWVYQPQPDGWHKQVQRVETAGMVQPIAVEGQLVLARRRPTVGRIDLDLVALRPQGPVAIGTIGMAATEGSSFTLLGQGTVATLIVRDLEGRTQWMQMDLTGQVVLEPTALTEARIPMVDRVMHWMLALVLPLVLIIIMLVFWRRDPQRNRVELPQGVRLAELTRRLLAAGIDMLPGLAIAASIHDVTMGQIIQNWPSWLNSDPIDYARLYPALTAIGLFIALTTPFELFTARTPGKMVLGLTVADVRGQPPRMWAILVRNILKAADLIFLPLLLIPLFGPFRQRMGDLIAGTVVIITPGEQSQPLDEDEQDSE